jgi:hypothetical protein
MAVFNGAFPVLPGKEDAIRSFTKEVFGSRLEQFNAQQAKAGITRETWTLQQTPMGSLVLVWFEGDVEKAFADLATDTDEFSTWFRAQVKDSTGVDFAAPDDSPPPEVLTDWSA